MGPVQAVHMDASLAVVPASEKGASSITDIGLGDWPCVSYDV